MLEKNMKISKIPGKGVTEKESQKIFEHINSTLFIEYNMTIDIYPIFIGILTFKNHIKINIKKN
jgi:hypothetical protein